MQGDVPKGGSFIQTKSNSLQIPAPAEVDRTAAAPGYQPMEAPPAPIAPVPAQGEPLALESLTPELQTMGANIFGSREGLVAFLTNSRVLTVHYAGVDMKIAMGKADNSDQKWANGEAYDLDTLIVPADETEAQFEQRRQQGTQMINMLDVGGNLGLVTIAAYKKYPGLVRAMIVEPVPATNFFLNVNLFLNAVPPLTVDPAQPGVNTVEHVVFDQKDVAMTMCTPCRDGTCAPWDAYAIVAGKACDCNVDKCDRVLSTTMEQIISVFDEEDISFLKMDCEDCEQYALPVVDKNAHRVRRLAIEMSLARAVNADIACGFNQGKYVRGTCLPRRAASTQQSDPEYLMGTAFCDKCA